MTDEEIQKWHAKLRDHRNFQTMQAHVNSLQTSTKKASKTKQDISEFI